MRLVRRGIRRNSETEPSRELPRVAMRVQSLQADLRSPFVDSEGHAAFSTSFPQVSARGRSFRSGRNDSAPSTPAPFETARWQAYGAAAAETEAAASKQPARSAVDMAEDVRGPSGAEHPSSAQAPSITRDAAANLKPAERTVPQAQGPGSSASLNPASQPSEDSSAAGQLDAPLAGHKKPMTQAGEPSPAGGRIRSLERFVEQAALQKQGDRHQMRLQWQDDHAGRISLRLTDRSGHIEALLRTDSSRARELLYESLPSLMESLNRRGFEAEFSRLPGGQREGAFDPSAGENRHPRQPYRQPRRPNRRGRVFRVSTK